MGDQQCQSLYISSFILSKAFTSYVPSSNYAFDKKLLSLRKVLRKMRPRNLETLKPPPIQGSLWLLTLRHGTLFHFHFHSCVRCWTQWTASVLIVPACFSFIEATGQSYNHFSQAVTKLPFSYLCPSYVLIQPAFQLGQTGGSVGGKLI